MVLQITSDLWNYNISLADRENDKKTKNDIIRQLSSTFVMEEDQTVGFFNKMIDRKNYLFPPEIQPRKK